MKDGIKGILIFITLCVIVMGIVYFDTTIQKEQNEKTYNNGVCTDCGGHYEFVSVAKNRNRTSTYYYYQCDTCEKIIKLRK